MNFDREGENTDIEDKNTRGRMTDDIVASRMVELRPNMYVVSDKRGIMISDHYVRKAEAARRLGVDRLTIWHWIKAGKLPAEKVGREVLIKVDDLSGITRSKRGRKSRRNDAN